MFNKLVGKWRASDSWGDVYPIRLRIIKVAKFAIANRLYVGEVVRFGGKMYIYNVEGRKTNTCGSAVRVSDACHVGSNCRALGCTGRPSLPSHARIVYIDVRKIRWCSVDNVAFHSFPWPRNTKEAKCIVRTLFITCCRANRVLDNLLWNWSKMGQPYIVYREGSVEIGGGDPVPAWLDEWCVYNDFCQCNLVGLTDSRGRARFPQHSGWHHPGAPYSNVMWRCHQFFSCNCHYSRLKWPYPSGGNRNTVNALIATKFTRTTIHVLNGNPPSVPPKVSRWCQP